MEPMNVVRVLHVLSSSKLVKAIVRASALKIS
jgi:hypothetical protein